jgi:1-phosphofructokinase
VIITVTLNPAIDQAIEVDRFVEGDANRIQSIHWGIGGKGINVARVLKELGYEPLAMGFAPGDLGRMIEDQLRDAGIGTDFVFVHGETRTNITILDRERHVHTVLNAPGPKADQADLDELFRRIGRRLRGDTWLVLAGSVPPPGDGATYGRLIEEAEARGALSALDADGPVVRQVLNEGGRPTLVKLNDHELSRVYGDVTRTEDEAFEAAEQLRALGVPAVVITRGSRGAIALTPDADYRVSAPSVEVESAIGAGDAFLAGLLLGLRRSEGWPRALARATAAGSASCLTPGTGLCRQRDVLRLMDEVRVERVAARTGVG